MTLPEDCPHILIIEDEKPIGRFLTTALQAEHLRVFTAETGRQGLIEASTRQPDLLIIDLGLPDCEGIDVIREIRAWSNIPILVLSARTQEQEKVQALNAGADDYLTKPFGVAELLARIRAHLRRQQAAVTLTEPEIHFGEIKVDLALRSVTRHGQVVHLTPIEYRLLLVLIRYAGKVLTHRQLLTAVWGPNYSDRSHYLRIYMGHLRQKLEQNPAQPCHLLTETGVGYRLILE
ncbi:MAG: two-component system response regulator KdpE [Thioploca sp.]|nr:two-component system response regulator KdpE [Thioploca sp.]